MPLTPHPIRKNYQVVSEIKSSNIQRIEHYTEDGIPTLRATFNNGSVYLYTAVPIEVFRVLCEADSIGSAFHMLIRGGSFDCIKDGSNVATMKL